MIVLGQASAGLVLAASLFTNSFWFPQFDTVADIPKDYFTENKVIFGIVERVIDGDTIRVRHCPTRFGCPVLDQSRKRIYDSTLSVRLYGVDCPELQKRTSDPPSQLFAEEAKEYTSNFVLGKTVQIKLLQRDRYGRALGKVQTGLQLFPPFSRKDISVGLTQRGLATLYTGGGAEYDGNRELLESKQEEAKRKRRGVWSHGDSMVSPADFKRQQKALKQATAI